MYQEAARHSFYHHIPCRLRRAFSVPNIEMLNEKFLALKLDLNCFWEAGSAEPPKGMRNVMCGLELRRDSQTPQSLVEIDAVVQ